MICLKLYGETDELAGEFHSTDFRITGGTIWKDEPPSLIAHYASGSWKHGDQDYPRLCVEGHCRLLFGIARAPSALSESIGVFSITNEILRANGMAFAQYLEDCEMWQGLARPIWWQAMRIISEGVMPLAVQESDILPFNPWDPAASAADPVFTWPDMVAERLSSLPGERSH